MVEVVPADSIELGQRNEGVVMIGDMLDALKDDEAIVLTMPRVLYPAGQVAESKRFKAWLTAHLNTHTKGLPYKASIRNMMDGRVAVFKVPR